MTVNYEADFYGWTIEQADLIRAGHSSQLDFENLLEEIESMGRSEKRALEFSLKVLLAHLLKWKYQPSYHGKSLELTIKEQRRKVNRSLKDNPSLKSKLPEVISNAYEDAILMAVKETGLDEITFPQLCPWEFETFINETFYP